MNLIPAHPRHPALRVGHCHCRALNPLLWLLLLLAVLATTGFIMIWLSNVMGENYPQGGGSDAWDFLDLFR